LAEIIAHPTFHCELFEPRVSPGTAAVTPPRELAVEVVALNQCLPDALPEDRGDGVCADASES
jgi:hypothetical protein